MSGGRLRHPLILLLLAGHCFAVVKNPITESVHDGSVLQLPAAHSDIFIQEMIIAPNSKVAINVTDVSSFTSFIIAQIHAYQYNVMLSYDEDFTRIVPSRTVDGSNIGLVIKPNSTITRLYLKNNNNESVQAIAAAIAYNNEAPVPGGCNMEFDHEIAPYAKVKMQDTMVIVDAQPASMPFNNKSNCDSNPVEHEMYQMYLTAGDFSAESYFQGIVNMLTVDDIRTNGIQVSHHKVTSPMRRMYSAYIGTGSVYATVATYGKISAAYVPAFSYACSPVQDPESCAILTDVFPKVVCAFCFILGIVSVLLGHTVYVYDQFIGFLFVGTMVGYIIAGTIGYGLLIGLVTAIVLCCIPMATSVNVGWLITCFIFFSSLDGFTILHINWVFGCFFVLTLILSSAIIALTGTTISAYITGVLYSSFMVVLPLDYWMGSSLKYILINLVRRATNGDFCDAVIIQPTQGKDIFLICLWVILALVRLANCGRLLTATVYQAL